ncbi:MAG TPA: hypothetical protein VM658_04525 [bacterium]|nr:hypothetical protein [bacterium]
MNADQYKFYSEFICVHLRSSAAKKKQKKNPKPGLPGKIYFLGQLAFNLGGVIFATTALAWIFFVNFGNGAGELAWVQSFVFLMVFFFTVIQCWGAVANTRRDFLRDKWVMPAPPETAPGRYVANPWRLILPLGLASGFIAAGAAALAVPRLAPEPFSFLNITLISGIPLFVASTVMIGIILPRDQAAFAAALPKTRPPAAPPGRYLWLEHILPWIPIQGCINFAVGLKQFGHEAEKLGAAVPIRTVALDAGFVCFLIVFICWFSAQVQVRPDVHLGRVAQDPGRAPSILIMLVICTGFTAVGAVVWAALSLAGLESLDPAPAAVIKAVVVMAAVVPGCFLGVWWGRRRETALIREKADLQDQAADLPSSGALP